MKALTFEAAGSTSLWRWRVELKWLFWGAPSWQRMEKGEGEEQRKGREMDRGGVGMEDVGEGRGRVFNWTAFSLTL